MSEWQTETDRYGVARRYRMIGSIKEYEKMVSINGVEVPESELAAFNKALAETEEENRARHEAISTTLKRCPFGTGFERPCRAKCALFTDRGCRIVNKALKTDTVGKQCPFNPYKCVSDCKLYDNGCMI